MSAWAATARPPALSILATTAAAEALLPAIHNHGEAVLRQALGNRGADPARSTRDDGNSMPEAVVVRWNCKKRSLYR
jgi:hypothetical protein